MTGTAPPVKGGAVQVSTAEPGDRVIKAAVDQVTDGCGHDALPQRFVTRSATVSAFGDDTASCDTKGVVRPNPAAPVTGVCCCRHGVLL